MTPVVPLTEERLKEIRDYVADELPGRGAAREYERRLLAALLVEVARLSAALTDTVETLESIDHEASRRPPVVVTGVGPDNHPTDRSEHEEWTIGTTEIRRVRIRKLARACLARVGEAE